MHKQNRAFNVYISTLIHTSLFSAQCSEYDPRQTNLSTFLNSNEQDLEALGTAWKPMKHLVSIHMHVAFLQSSFNTVALQ